VLTANTITNDSELTIALAGETAAVFSPNGSVWLYYDNGNVFKTVTGGIESNTLQSLSADTDLTLTAKGTGVISFNDDWEAAGQTCSDAGTLTTVDINGGTIDGTPIAGSTGSFTTVDASTDVTLATDAKLILTVPAADAKATAIMIAGQDLDSNTPGSAAAGGIVYMNASSEWNTADHDTLAESGPVMLAMVTTAVESGDPVELMTYGMIRETGWGWTVGAVLYLGNTGEMTETAPTTDGEIIRIMGYALTADIVMFNPSPDWIVYAA
jgi:hypothetical protein